MKKKIKIIFLSIFLIILFIYNIYSDYSVFHQQNKSFIKYQCRKTKVSAQLEINKNRIHVKIKDNIPEQQIEEMLKRNNIINYVIDKNNQYIYIVDKKEYNEIISNLKKEEIVSKY